MSTEPEELSPVMAEVKRYMEDRLRGLLLIKALVEDRHLFSKQQQDCIRELSPELWKVIVGEP